MDIYTIIFLALAVFIFLRLRNVLGQRTGSERPPFDRAARDVVQGAPDSNVVPMPGSVIDQPPMAPTAEVVPASDRWKGVTEPGTPLAAGLDSIVAQDASFDPRHFISGARASPHRDSRRLDHRFATNDVGMKSGPANGTGRHLQL